MPLTCCIESHCTHATLAPAHTSCLFSIDLHTVRHHLVIVHFLLLLLLSGTLLQMMSRVPHHCLHLSLVCRHTCFVQFTKTELHQWTQYICTWLGHVIALLMVFPKNALMFINISQINYSWLSAYFNAVVYNAVYSACLFNAVYIACLLNAVCRFI